MREGVSGMGFFTCHVLLEWCGRVSVGGVVLFQLLHSVCVCLSLCVHVVVEV